MQRDGEEGHAKFPGEPLPRLRARHDLRGRGGVAVVCTPRQEPPPEHACVVHPHPSALAGEERRMTALVEEIPATGEHDAVHRARRGAL